MSTASSDDVCRTRYDQIVFAADGASSRERRWLLELGAMTVLESELETLSVDDGASTAAEEGNRRGRERESYKSCLEAMLDGHYDTLSETCA